jgi:ABC-type phosphate transport system substrate-binding protein
VTRILTFGRTAAALLAGTVVGLAGTTTAIAPPAVAAPAFIAHARQVVPTRVKRVLPRASGIPTPIYAGGGSVPALMLRAWGNLYGVTPGQPAPPGSPNVELLYAASSGGSGQRYFLAQSFDALSPIAPNPPYTDTTNGRNFTYPYPGSPDFAIGSQLSIADHMTYKQNVRPTRGKAIVVPVAETAQALAYNLGPNASLGSRSLKLSRASYCGIFTGVIVDWSDPQITADNGGSPVVSSPTTIDVVYRSDGSGTTFMLTDHLHDICAAAGHPFTGTVGETFPVPNPVPPGASFVGANGGSAEIAAVLHPLSGHGAVGYITPSFVQPLNPSGPPAALVYNAAGNAVAPTGQSAYLAVLHGPFVAPPPGYPQTMPHTYITDPRASTAYPIVGMMMMYFYGCSPSSNPDIPAMKGFFTAALLPKFGGPPTAYDILAEQAGLGELPDVFKSHVLRAINSIQSVPPSGTCTSS